MGFSGQEYWSGLPFPSPGDLPHPGIESLSPARADRFFTSEPPGKPPANWSLVPKWLEPSRPQAWTWGGGQGANARPTQVTCGVLTGRRWVQQQGWVRPCLPTGHVFSAGLSLSGARLSPSDNTRITAVVG